MNHKCPYLKNKKSCDYKSPHHKRKIVCVYKDCNNCPYYNVSKTMLKIDTRRISRKWSTVRDVVVNVRGI